MWHKQRAARQKSQGQGGEARVVNLNNNFVKSTKSAGLLRSFGECLCQHKYVSSSSLQLAVQAAANPPRVSKPSASQCRRVAARRSQLQPQQTHNAANSCKQLQTAADSCRQLQMYPACTNRPHKTSPTFLSLSERQWLHMYLAG